MAARGGRLSGAGASVAGLWVGGGFGADAEEFAEEAEAEFGPGFGFGEAEPEDDEEDDECVESDYSDTDVFHGGHDG